MNLQGRDLEAGNEADAMEECSLLTRVSWLAQPDILLQADNLLRVVTAYNGLGLPRSVTDLTVRCFLS